MAKNTGKQRKILQPMRWGGNLCTQGSQAFFFSFRGGCASVGFLLFPMSSHQVHNGFWTCSQWVPTKFTMGSEHVPNEFPPSSQWVLNMFPKYPNCSPTCSNNSGSLYSIYFALSCTLITYISSRKKEFTTYLFLGIHFFSDGPIKYAHHKRGRNELWGSPQLINMYHK
jgi:hypothetical protein